MHLGLIMECDYREGTTQEEAFEEAFAQVELAETYGLDGVWLAERHFAAPRRALDALGTGIPSIASVPLILASAIAARTTRLRIGTAVSVLPLCHPIRTAEEAATIDQISKGRLDFGVGRSGFPTSYKGYAIPYEESRGLFREYLEVIVRPGLRSASRMRDNTTPALTYVSFPNPIKNRLRPSALLPPPRKRFRRSVRWAILSS